MAKMLKDALKTIEKYKSITPHYGELLDILEEILIMREEYRRKIERIIFPIDEELMEKKIAGGLPLIDLMRDVGNIDDDVQPLACGVVSNFGQGRSVYCFIEGVNAK